MLLLFHQGINDEGLHGVTGTFSPIDKDVYVTVIFEEDDDLQGFKTLQLRCMAGSTLLCAHEWSLLSDRNVYTMWFDVQRIANRYEFPRIPLVCEAYLDGEMVLQNQAELTTSPSYSIPGQKGAYR